MDECSHSGWCDSNLTQRTLMLLQNLAKHASDLDPADVALVAQEILEEWQRLDHDKPREEW